MSATPPLSKPDRPTAPEVPEAPEAPADAEAGTPAPSDVPAPTPAPVDVSPDPVDVSPERRSSARGPWERARPVVLPVGSLLLFLLLWQVVAASGTWSETLVPSPARVWDAFVSVSTTHDGVRGYNGTYLVEHLGISLRRIAIGAGVGIALGVLFGLLMGTARPAPRTARRAAVLARQSLSPGLRAYVDTLTAVHDGTREFGYYLAQQRQGRGNLWEGEVFTALTPVEHPVVRVHPESGRKGLFVNPGFTSHIVGVSEHESRGLLDILYAHLTKPEHVVRHRWQPGDVALWDNRSTAHYANRDYGDRHRVMHRITLRGDTPVGPATAPR
ncbi:TauD/TfdA family dioxygenase [Streptomyces sp. NPDC051773]|uniref:TauD/TfdA family dioxygenase n=1 Tax=Streptomyces sp. NPDC051773 TaxID=3156682 RepID=UPI003445B31C